MRRTYKLILAHCAVENGNRGCVALTFSTIYIIKKLMEEKGFKCEFYLLNSGHHENRKYILQSGGVELEYYAISNIVPMGIVGILKPMIKIKDTLTTLKLYKQADAILDIGAGDSFTDIYGQRRFYSIYTQHRVGAFYKLPYCLLPQTIGPFNNPNIRKKAVKEIKRVKCVLTRDKQSYDYVRKIAPGKEVTECIDVAFFMPYEREHFQEGYIHVGLNISALLWHGGYTRNNQFGLKTDYQHLVRSIINYFLTINGVKLHLVPHVVGGERHIENDFAVSYDLWKEYSHDNLLLAPMFLDPIIAKGYIGGLDFFMGARMHSTIAAFSTGVPVVPMAYSRKFNGLFIDTLNYKDVVDLKTMDDESALSFIEECFARRDNERLLINEQMNTTVRERGELLKKKLSEFLMI